MNDSDKKRDVMDMSVQGDFPAENRPNAPTRPRVGDLTEASSSEGDFFLDKFLNEPKVDEAQAEASMPIEAADMSPAMIALRETIIEALREIYDPEIPVNIYEMGLIYAVNVAEDASVEVVMTLTTPHCPVAESMPGEIELKVASVPGVMEAKVNLVWEPPWEMSCMSDEARLELGLL